MDGERPLKATAGLRGHGRIPERPRESWAYDAVARAEAPRGACGQAPVYAPPLRAAPGDRRARKLFH